MKLDLYSPGIYKIVNNITHDIYIGSSANRSGMGSRFSQHKKLLRRGVHFNPRLQHAWNKYGDSNFSFVVIEFCTRALSIIREQYYFDLMKPEYNILQFAGSRLGSKASPETLEKLKGRIPWNKGMKKAILPPTPEELLERERFLQESILNANIKRSLSMSGRKKDPEVVERIAQKRRKPVIATNLITNIKLKFEGVRIAARFLNLDISMISKVCKGRHKYYKEWTFSYGC